ncbi:MAG: electron transport complex subunit E [Bacillota bacterium]|nr:electron transport complex subunit E [Bacillota bacterium]
MRSPLQVLTNGLVKENPAFRLVLGLCPMLAVTTAAENGFWMGMAVIFVLTFSNVFISALSGVIPSKIRIPCYIVVIATFVTIVDLVMHAYLPEMYNILGIFIPLIVVNCVIMARAEAFASKNGLLFAAMDGIGMGLGYTVAIMLIGAIRELLGTGNILLRGVPLFGAAGLGFEPAIVMILPPGAFITLGLVLGVLNTLQQRRLRQRGA